MHPSRGIERTYRRSYGLSKIPDDQITLTRQSVATDDAPRDLPDSRRRYMESWPFHEHTISMYTPTATSTATRIYDAVVIATITPPCYEPTHLTLCPEYCHQHQQFSSCRFQLDST